MQASNSLTDWCHQCEAGILIAYICKFLHGQSDSETLKAEDWHIITPEAGLDESVFPLINQSHTSLWCMRAWALNQKCLKIVRQGVFLYFMLESESSLQTHFIIIFYIDGRQLYLHDPKLKVIQCWLKKNIAVRFSSDDGKQSCLLIFMTK